MNGFRRRGWRNSWQQLREMEREFGRLLGEDTEPRGAAFPPLNVFTDGDGALVTAEVPGVDSKDLEITVRDRTLVLHGERKVPETGEDDTWLRRERLFGRFARSLDLPFAVDSDNVDATYRDGVLKIRLQRSEVDKPRQITIKS